MVAAPSPTPAAEARIDAATAQAEASEMTAAETAAIIDNSAIAAAEERVAEAERAAEQVALAAINSRIGQEISDLRNMVQSWQTAHETVHSGLSTAIRELTDRIAALESKVTVVAMIPETPASPVPSSIQPALTAEVLNPETAGVSEEVTPEPAADRAKKKMRLI